MKFEMGFKMSGTKEYKRSRGAMPSWVHSKYPRLRMQRHCPCFVRALSTVLCLTLLVVWKGLAFEPAPTSSSKADDSGSTLTEAQANHQRMLNLLKNIKDQTPEDHLYLGDAYARSLRSKFAAWPKNAPPQAMKNLRFKLGQQELMLGNEIEAISHLVEAEKLRSLMDGPESEKTIQATFRLGVAYLRQGETQNCCRRNSPDSCILPIQGEGIHQDQEGSKKAIHCFLKMLKLTQPGSLMHLRALWLLNVAYMTIGGYPDDIPEPYRIPTDAFRSQVQFPRFKNLAAKLGLDTMSLSGGAIADDFNNDGYLDLLVSTWDPAGQIRFFVNNGDGTFSDRTERAGLLGIYGGLNMVQADYNNDGHVDALVLRGAWLYSFGRHPNSLLRNNGDGTFIDVTFQAGLGVVHYPTQTAAWSDYDLDGDLDLYVSNEVDSIQKGFYPGQLFRNSGDGTFTDVAETAGVTNMRFAKAVTWGDYNNDRLPDLFVSNLNDANRLYRNKGDGTFADVAEQLGVTGPNESFPAWFWDFDNDGQLDLFVSSYAADIADVASAYLGRPFNPDLHMRLYRNNGQCGFKDVARQYQLLLPTLPMGSNFGDLDNDGYLDFYLGTGDPDYRSIMPNLMYLNQNGQRFVDVSMAGGFAHLQKGHAVVFADFDNDGDQDVFEQLGGALAGDGFHDAFYQNPGFGNNWIGIQLEGVKSNRSAIGSRIAVQVMENEQHRTIYKHVNSGGSFGGNPLRQTLGLGRAKVIERLAIQWPTTGKTQVFPGVPVNQFIKIVEGENHYTPLPLRATDPKDGG